jgi:hypothetical protein
MREGLWLLIPIVAILSGAFRSWLRVRASQQVLGASTRELEREVAALSRMKAELTERIQNLETIVVSQTWGVLNDRNLQPADRDSRLAILAHHETSQADSAQVNQQRAEQLAQRLQ